MATSTRPTWTQYWLDIHARTDMLLVISSELVVLMGESVARVVTSRQGSLRFVYDEEYRRLPTATPLTVSMPIERMVYARSRLRQTYRQTVRFR